jgi:hypothetical protein
LIYKIIRSNSKNGSKKAENAKNGLKSASETNSSTNSSSDGSSANMEIRRSNWSIDRIHQVLEKLLAINPEVMDKKEAVLAVKYKTFNDLLGRLPKKFWPDYAFIWIIFTCDILLIGLVRDYRNAFWLVFWTMSSVWRC